MKTPPTYRLLLEGEWIRPDDEVKRVGQDWELVGDSITGLAHSKWRSEYVPVRRRTFSDFVHGVAQVLGVTSPNLELAEVIESVMPETTDPKWAAVLVMQRTDPSDRWKEVAHKLGFTV
jgi:hypothetical protein